MATDGSRNLWDPLLQEMAAARLASADVQRQVDLSSRRWRREWVRAASATPSWEAVRRLSVTLCTARMALRIRAARFDFQTLAQQICSIRERALADFAEGVVADDSHSLRV